MLIWYWSSDVCSSDLVGFGHAVDPGRDVGTDPERADIGVVAFAAEQRVAVIALARHDQIALAIVLLINRHPLDIVLQCRIVGDGGKHRAGGAAARFGALAPDADILFADIEHARLVVGDTAFDLAFERQLADQFYADLARQIGRAHV